MKKAKNQVPRLVREALEDSNLKGINISNLQEGKDSEGENMPSYSNPDYANFKTSINPKNRGFWDLRLHGEYYRGIDVRIYATQVFFVQTISNPKMAWLKERLDFYNKTPLGITKKQMEQVQLDNKPKIQKAIYKILNNG